jgi:two-component system, NtrC family, sensor kinase
MHCLTPKTPRMLIVDDNRSIHEDFRKILSPDLQPAGGLEAAEAALFGAPAETKKAMQFELDSAYQGREALELVRQSIADKKPYAMAFMDVRMPPGWDGIETTAAIWQLDPDIQIVICTAYSDYSWSELHDKLGHTDRLVILKKPFDNIEVLQLAHAVCEKWRLLQQTRANVFELETKIDERTAELRESQEMVLRQERLAAVGQLSAGVAHDFNNILTVIQGHAEMLLLSAAARPESINSLKEISKSATRAAKLTQQLLAFSRKQVMKSKNVSLFEVARNLSSMLVRALGERIVLRLEQGNLEVPAVYADPAMIEQVLMNLVVNARDAMPDGGELTMGTEVVELSERQQQQDPEARGGKFVCLTVRDTGCGMDAGTLKHIFEPFFTTKEVGKGTGLGLATVYGIVKQHRGWVHVESIVGQGTTFYIYFPVANEMVDAPAKKVEPLPISSGRHGGETILVVEDEAAVRALARKIFQNRGYRVLEAASGDQAVELINQTQESIDLVVTDLVMPGGISGRDLGQMLQAREPRLKVLFTSGYSQDFAAAGFLEEGVNFLSKPYSPPALLEMVRLCLNKERDDIAPPMPVEDRFPVCAAR